MVFEAAESSDLDAVMLKTTPAALAVTDPKFRVKVYELNEEGEWTDKGTGHVQFQIVQV